MRLQTCSLFSVVALGLQSVGVVAVAGRTATLTTTANTALITTCSEVPVNQLSNGGFESGSISPWRLTNGHASVVNYASEASEGSYYFALTSTWSGNFIEIFQSFTGVEGTAYTISFQYKAILSGSVGCRMSVAIDSSAGIISNTIISSDVDEWTTFSSTQIVRSSSVSAGIVMTCIVGMPTLELDNIQITSSMDEQKECTTSTSTIIAAPSSSNVAAASSPAVALPSSSVHISSQSPSSSTVGLSKVSSYLSVPSSVGSHPSSDGSAPSSSFLVHGVSPSSSISLHPMHSPAPISSSRVAHPSSSSTARHKRPCSKPKPSRSISTSSIPLITSSSGLPVSTGGAGNGHDSGSGSGSSKGNGHSGSSGNHRSGSGADSGKHTTSTIFSTRTSQITACASTVTDCPARERTTYITTETIVVSTTVCPVTAEATTTSAATDSGQGSPYVTTETVLTTRVSTIYECAAAVTDCPARKKTTSITTETLVAGTTVYTVKPAQAGPTITGAPDASDIPTGSHSGAAGTSLTTDTIYMTHVETIYECPNLVADCPLTEKEAHTFAQTTAVGTTVYPVTVIATATSSIEASATDVGSGSTSGSSSIAKPETSIITLISVPTSPVVVPVGAGAISSSAFATSAKPFRIPSASYQKVTVSSSSPVETTGLGSTTTSSSGPIYTGGAGLQLSLSTTMALVCGLGAMLPFAL